MCWGVGAESSWTRWALLCRCTGDESVAMLNENTRSRRRNQLLGWRTRRQLILVTWPFVFASLQNEDQCFLVSMHGAKQSCQCSIRLEGKRTFQIILSFADHPDWDVHHLLSRTALFDNIASSEPSCFLVPRWHRSMFPLELDCYMTWSVGGISSGGAGDHYLFHVNKRSNHMQSTQYSAVNANTMVRKRRRRETRRTIELKILFSLVFWNIHRYETTETSTACYPRS